MSSKIAWTLAGIAIAVAVYVGQADSQQTGTVDVAALPFSAARAAGDTLYVSGQIAVRPDGSVVEGTVADETRQVMENIGAVLEEHGYGFADVVSVTVYLSDMEHYQEMNATYRTFFPDGNFPARACVGGLQIAFNTNVEIQCVAYKETRTTVSSAPERMGSQHLVQAASATEPHSADPLDLLAALETQTSNDRMTTLASLSNHLQQNTDIESSVATKIETALVEIASDTDREDQERRIAMWGLAKLEETSTETLDLYMEILKESNDSIMLKQQAASSLASRARTDAAMRESLIGFAESGNPYSTRIAALSSMATLPVDSDVERVLRESINDPDSKIRGAALAGMFQGSGPQDWEEADLDLLAGIVRNSEETLENRELAMYRFPTYWPVRGGTGKSEAVVGFFTEFSEDESLPERLRKLAIGFYAVSTRYSEEAIPQLTEWENEFSGALSTAAKEAREHVESAIQRRREAVGQR